MAKKQRLSRKVLQEDLEAFAALQAIADYKPNNEEFTLSNVAASHAAMGASQTDEVQKQDAADAARDTAATDEYGFHEMILGAKTQVKGQFGVNSNQYQSMGMKKKKEYKTGKRAKKPTSSIK